MESSEATRICVEQEIDWDDYELYTAILARPRDAANVDYLQHVYDDVFPSHHGINTEFDDELAEEAFSQQPMYDIGLILTRGHLRKSEYDCMEPLFKTYQVPLRDRSQFQTLNGFARRNMNAPQNRTSIAVDTLVTETVDAYVNVYVKDKKLFKSFASDPILPNFAILQEWLVKQPGAVCNELDEGTLLHEIDGRYYEAMIKRVAKVKPEDLAPHSYPASQMIAYHPKPLNAYFSLIFAQMKERLHAVLKDEFLILTDLSPREVSERLMRWKLQGAHHFEVDFSKYDKCQDRVTLTCECEMMRRLGVRERDIRLWYYIHQKSWLVDFKNGVRIRLCFQRRSGDSGTFFGNTFMLMASLARMIEQCEEGLKLLCGMFAGDDSLLFFNRPVPDFTEGLSQLYNLDAKIITNDSLYFCSKFLTVDGLGRRWLVPDPVKLLMKLGRRDIRNPQHLHEYYVSLCDLTKELVYVEDSVDFHRQLIARYGFNNSDPGVFLTNLNSVLRDEELFKSLFDNGENMCMDPSYPKLLR